MSFLEDFSEGKEKSQIIFKQVSKLASECYLAEDLDTNGSDSDPAHLLVGQHRHKVLLQESLQSLSNFLNADLSVDMACEELRMAL